MLTHTDRARDYMDSTRDHRHRISAAVQVDRLFDNYQLEMAPAEALSYAVTVPENTKQSEAIYGLIESINRLIPATDFGSTHPRTGTAHHRYWVGREHGERVITLEIFQGYLTPDFSVAELEQALVVLAERVDSSLARESSESGHRFSFQWKDGNR